MLYQKYLKLVAYKQHLFLTLLEAGKSKIMALVDLCLLRASLLTDDHLLPELHIAEGASWLSGISLTRELIPV